ncbi:MAG TPA: carboxylating nicotinate-nucleotide diphosphorylase [Legionellales bacterium]|nr:carboxylating nicotinate-nucleotide diphosphorylase [Legionellales bacterium]
MKFELKKLVELALAEDIGTGDITAQLIPKDKQGQAVILAKEAAVVCGIEYVNEVIRQVDTTIEIKWLVQEGGYQKKPCDWAILRGPLRSILTVERTALNFLQTLSAIATKTRSYVSWVQGSKTKILDTRKTIPGLRYPEKYAVRCGGGNNHRMGLYDEFLIKENHIEAMGSISKAIEAAQKLHADKPIVVEVQNILEFKEARKYPVTRIMLDNFSDEMIEETVAENQNPQRVIEVSGGIDEKRIQKLVALGVDCISIGDLTKSIRAIDLSLLVRDESNG